MKNAPEYFPPYEAFREKAKKGNLIPVYREIMADLETPVGAFMKIRNSPYAYLLESVEGGEKWGRYTFLGSQPLVVIRGTGRTVEILRGKKKEILKNQSDPIGVLKDYMKQFRPVEVEGLPRFFGGAVGYLSYDIVRFFESLPDHHKPGLGLPDLYFLITDTLLIFDSAAQKIKVVSNAALDGTTPQAAYRTAVRRIEALIAKLRKPVRIPRRRRPARRAAREETSNLKREEFEKLVVRAKEYIRAGDAFQIALSQRFETEIESDPVDIYRCLRVINPSPYMYCLQLGKLYLVGSSPEVMVRREDGRIEVRPIAGTRRRGRTEAEDRELEEELKHDEKEKAEHIMLVDLGRNDLGRVSRTGTVRVDELMKVERYSHVMHLVSHVTGELAGNGDSFDVMRACFPAGTLSGAPKIRAMEIIEELEPTRRGPYAGAVGYFSFSGNMDTCINIRTVVIVGRRAYIQAGAGIVADSDPAREYQETVNKAKGMLAAIRISERGFE
jgi:anthranilate synthase component 1